MRRFLLTRVVQSAATLAILSVVGVPLEKTTVDPRTLIRRVEATPQDYANALHEFGLDRPLPVQYARFMAHVLRGDFGMSLYARLPVNQLIGERLPNSLKLASFSMAVSVLLAFPLGVMAAVKKNTAVDRTAQVIAVLGQSLPTFWVGIVLIDVVAGRLQWLPAGDIGGLSHYVLPGFTLGWFVVAGMMRLVRSGMLEVLDSEYVKMARVKGVREPRVIWLHALRNALIPVVTFAGVYFAVLVTTAVIVETAVIVAAVNLGVDCLYAVIDPRIRRVR